MGECLVVEDDRLEARVLSRLVRKETSFEVAVATSVPEAFGLLEPIDRWSLFLVDLRLGRNQEGGFDVLSRIAAHRVMTLRALVTGCTRARIAERATILGAAYLVKPLANENFRDFMRRLPQVRREPVQDAVSAAVAALAELARETHLSPTERALVEWRLRGGSEKEFCDQRQITINTWRKHRSGALAKTQTSSLEILINQLFRAQRKAS